MGAAQPRPSTLRNGAIAGAVVVFLIVAGISLALGAGWALALGIGLFVGVFVGGGLGLLVASRAGAAKSG